MRIARCAVALLVVAACRPSSQTIDVSQDGGVVEDAGDIEADAGEPDAGVDAGPAPVCSLQVFSYPNGYACNSDGDCQSGHCGIPTPGEWPTLTGANPGICTSTCQNQGSADECNTGYSCEFGYSITPNSPTDLRVGLYCLPVMGTGNLPSNASLPTGSPCWKPSDCAGTGAVCGSINYGAYLYTFCAPTCDATHACGECSACTQPFATAQKYCTFQGPRPIGEPCVHHQDCQSNFCDGFCTAACSATTACPEGATCHTFTYNEQTVSACINPSQVGGSADGSDCVFDFECAANSRCVAGTEGVSVCTPLASLGETCLATTSCKAGLDCRQLASTLLECSRDCGLGCANGETCYAPELNTELRVYNANGTQVAYSDNIPGSTSLWSRTSPYLAQPGNYSAAVRLSQGQYRGKYKLAITDDVGTATQVWRELPESPTNNDTRANAQAIPFPVELTGELSSPSDVDYFSFTVTQAVRITLETSPGAPTACLPSAQVATRALGEHCTVSFNCQDGMSCDASLLTCTRACTTDPDCGGNGATCQTVAGRKVCVSAAQVGQVASGQECGADWQCVSGASCVTSATGRVCAPPCGEASDGGAATTTCEGASECAAATNSSGAMVQACLPLGHRDGPFGATCVLQSDCAEGLACMAGRCGRNCATTDECPFRPSFSPNPIVCRPCTDSAQCTTMTEGGSCVTIDANERFCALPCDAAGRCPTGFSCTAKQPIDSYSSVAVCEPLNKSCHAPVCTLPEAGDGGTSGSGTCTVPPLAYAAICSADSECTTGQCSSGFCSKACQSNADCECPSGDLICSGSTCVPGADATEVEPNEATGSAQTLVAPAKIRASLKADGYDVDGFSIALTAGQKLTVITRPVCGVGATGASTYVLLYDSANTLLTYVTSNGYSTLRNYFITTDGTYTIKINDGTYPPSGRESAYILEVTTSQ